MEYGNEEHLDLRQRKTRKLLVEALAQLLEEESFQELSVTDICRRAMVHRTTFYAHFNDKQELLRYLLEGLERECAATCLPQDPERSPREYLLTAARNVFQFFAQRRALYRACLNSGADTLAHTLEDCAAGELCRLLSEPRFRAVSPQVDPQVAAHFYTALCFPSSAGGSPAMILSPPATCCPTWNNSFPFSEALLCRKNVRKVP